MRILHTSDWHIGRTFHGHSTDDHLEQVLGALAQAVTDYAVDVVIVAGDVFDSSTPKGEAFTLLNQVIGAIKDAGARVLLTSGNHDGPARLGHMAQFAAFGGVHIHAQVAHLARPVVATDDHGDVLLYGIPYLHPEFVRSAFPDFAGTTHGEALEFAMGLIEADALARAGADARWVVAAHCFASGEAGGEGAGTGDLSGRAEERDITRGGLNIVAPSVFGAATYAALGHIHSRGTLAPTVRYSGAPLRFSFGERSSSKGVWLVDIGAPGTPVETTWLNLPTPRAAVRLTGTLDALLADAEHEHAEQAWVEVVLTDDVRPRDSMRRIQERFPYAVTLTHRPANVGPVEARTYTERVRGKSDEELVDGFLSFVRGGHGATAGESAILREALDKLETKEATR